MYLARQSLLPQSNMMAGTILSLENMDLSSSQLENIQGSFTGSGDVPLTLNMNIDLSAPYQVVTENRPATVALSHFKARR